MKEKKRVFILGAGFSKPAGMPLATELLPSLAEKIDDPEMLEWLEGMRERLEWLAGIGPQAEPFKLNIEEVFHIAHFDAEAHRLKQHLEPVGRYAGSGTAWSAVEDITSWLKEMEWFLRDVICEYERQADVAPILRWAETLSRHDAVLTFNYDTLVENALSTNSIKWHHGLADAKSGTPVYKLHGSIDWIYAHRLENFSGLDLLFDKPNENEVGGDTGHVEEDYRLWRCQTKEQWQAWIEGRELQRPPEGKLPREVGIGGLGAYKQLYSIPGLGVVWTKGMQALYKADRAIVVGFSLSDFDAMAQMQFAMVARQRSIDGNPLQVTVVDPFVNERAKERFKRVFRTVEFVDRPHETVDWSEF